MQVMRKSLLILIYILFSLSLMSQSVRYVKPDAHGSGASWNDAGDLQAVIDASLPGDEVWVAAGTYIAPKGDGFVMKDGVSVYGGFLGTESGNHVPGANDTIGIRLTRLEGGSGRVVTQQNDFKHVTEWAGFQISKGDATNAITQGVLNENNGGGVLLHQNGILSFSIVKDNVAASPSSSATWGRGGGVYNAGGIVRNCIIRDNIGNRNSSRGKTGSGGGVFNGGDVYNSIIQKNQAAYNEGYGGGIDNYISGARVYNCIVSGNIATTTISGGGGGIRSREGTLVINCTVVKNISVKGFLLAEYAGGIHVDRGGWVYNSVLCENYSASILGIINNVGIYTASERYRNCIFQEVLGNTGSNNIYTNPAPYFVNFDEDDYRLKFSADNPMYNNGDNDLISSVTTTDFAGTQRIFRGTADIGAFEAIPDCITTLYVDGSASGSNDGSSWSNAYKNFADALEHANVCPNVTNIAVAKGTYYPLYTPPTTSKISGMDKTFYTNRKGLHIKGGYNSADGSHSSDNVSVLSGGYVGLTAAANHSYHVLLTTDADNTLQIESFTVTAGNGNGNGEITVNSHSINRYSGGAFYNANSSPKITSVIINGNEAGSGAGMLNENASTPVLTNVLIFGNNALLDGGGICNINSSPVLTNVTIADNKAANGGGIMNMKYSIPDIRNTIIYNNSENVNSDGNYLPIYNYTLVGGQDISGEGIGNFDGTNPANDPLFISSGNINEGYKMAEASPLLRKGNSSFFLSTQAPDLTSITGDIIDFRRIISKVIDLGAYQHKVKTSIPLENKEVVYDGLALGVDKRKVQVEGVDIAESDYNWVTYTYTGTGSTSYGPSQELPTDAGTYSVKGTYTPTETNTAYYIPSEATVDFTIKKANVAIVLTAKSVAYSGLPIGIDAPVITGGTAESDLTFTTIYRGTGSTSFEPGTEPPTDAGTYSVSVSTEGDGNHNAATSTTTLVISQLKPVLSLSDATYTYDGNPKSQTATSVPPGLNIMYSYAGTLFDGTPYPTSEIAPTDAGTYTVTTTFEGDTNYEGVSVTANLIIKRQEVSIEMSSKSAVYTGNAISIDAPVTIPSGLSLTVTYDGLSTPPVNVGGYSVLAGYAGNNNYNSAKANASLTVTSPGIPSLTMDNKSVTYDGKAHAIESAKINDLLASHLDITYIYENASYKPTSTPPADAGVYTVTATTGTDINFPVAGSVHATLTINKADQIIIFDQAQLDIKETDDVPFALEATSTNSNIPIEFISGETSIASIEGNIVTIHSAGTVTITATQAGDNNYNPATAVIRVMNVIKSTSDEAELLMLYINNTEHEIGTRYIVPEAYTEATLPLAVEVSPGATVEELPSVADVSKPSTQTITFKVISEDATITKYYSFEIEKRFRFIELVITRWNNTLTVINNAAVTGYTFSAYEWYRNGELMQDQTTQSYSAGKDGEMLNATDSYYVKVKDAATGDIFQSWPGYPDLKSAASIKIYPVPAKMGETIYLDADIGDELLEGAVIEAYTSIGVRVKTIRVEGRLTPINLPRVTGTYILYFKAKNGYFKSFKTIVR